MELGVSIRNKISDAIAAHPDHDSETIARNLLNKTSKSELFPLLLEEIEHVRRAITKNHERAVARSQMASFLENAAAKHNQPTSLNVVNDFVAHIIQQRRELLVMEWSLGDGTKVEIGEATVEQIRQRLNMLRKQHSGLGQTIRDLEAIEAELVRSGCNCLNDMLNNAA